MIFLFVYLARCERVFHAARKPCYFASIAIHYIITRLIVRAFYFRKSGWLYKFKFFGWVVGGLALLIFAQLCE